MLVYSFQDHGIVDDALTRNGVYEADARQSSWLSDDDDMFHDAYRWMHDQMVTRHRSPMHDHANITPIWSYARWADHEYHGAWNWTPSAIVHRCSSRMGHKPSAIPRRRWHADHLRKLEGFYDWIDGLDLITLDIPEDRLLLTDFDLWHYVLNQWPITEDDDLDDLSYEDMAATWTKSILPLDTMHDYVQATFWEILPSDVIAIEHVIL
jgi:hypothetical protein